MACLTGARVSTELVLSAKPFHRYKKVLVLDRHSPPWGRKGKVEVKKYGDQVWGDNIFQ